MYSKINTQSGAASVSSDLGNFTVSGNATDGLTVDVSNMVFPVTATMPDRLYNWLLDLRLLRNIPLDYLVPDSALLPTESIRFFHVDQTWVDRVIDGVFAAADTGSVDITYSVGVLAAIRTSLDQGLEDFAKTLVSSSTWTPSNGITGMLIRSELVRRWPDIIVRAYAYHYLAPRNPVPPLSVEIPVLRAEPVSKDIFIALFAGTPDLVQIREPHVGVRFGIEVGDTPGEPPFYVEKRDTTGIDVVDNKAQPTLLPITFDQNREVQLHPVLNQAGLGTDSRAVAISLMRPAYVQQFGNSIWEAGSSTPSIQPESTGYEVPQLQ